MSLILDALRKMEQERKTRRGAALDLRPEVLRYHADVKPKRTKPYLVMAAGGVVLAAGIGAGVLVTRSQAPATPAGPAAIAPVKVADTPASAAPAAPQSPVVAASALSPAPATAVTAPAAPAVAAAPPVVPTQPQALPARPDTPAADSKKKARHAQVLQSQPLQREVTEEPAVSIPDITVSGIAWQEERRLRRAVVNGVLVAEGAQVAGARVVEIKDNRVRLSRGGQIFDVLFSSGLNPQ